MLFGILIFIGSSRKKVGKSQGIMST